VVAGISTRVLDEVDVPNPCRLQEVQLDNDSRVGLRVEVQGATGRRISLQTHHVAARRGSEGKWLPVRLQLVGLEDAPGFLI